MGETNARVRVNAARRLGPLRRIWASIGYDELNWTITPRGKALYRLLREEVFSAGPYYVRMHNAFTSGNGLASPAWGAGDPYHEMPDGTPHYRWEILDRVYDTIVAGGGIPLVELGFMPRDLSRAGRRSAEFGVSNDLGRESYETNDWKEPPHDLARWGELVSAFVAHVVARYGPERTAAWRFELWNEPDIPNYWRGTVEEYLALWDVTLRAAKRSFPAAQVGGPATTDRGTAFLERFLAHLESTGQTPDFLSFHTKGAYFSPRRRYNPFVDVPRDSPSTAKMLADVEKNLAVIARFPRFAAVPVYVDECDPAVGTIYGVHDNPNFVVANSEHYPSFVCQFVARVLDHERVTEITHWAFYMEAKRWFEGNRTLVDNENVERPILNGLRLLERLAGGERLALEADSTGVGGLAVTTASGPRLLLWHHEDPWWSEGTARVEFELAGASGTSEAAAVWRLDRAHANTFRAWEALGAPDEPTPEQVAQIRTAGRLRPEPLALERDGEVLRSTIELPMHGLALIELDGES